MDISLSGRTTEEARPDLALTVSVAEGWTTIRFDDHNNLPFWVEARIPSGLLLKALSEQGAYIRHHADPKTGEPDEGSCFEVAEADDPEADPEQPDDESENLVLFG